MAPDSPEAKVTTIDSTKDSGGPVQFDPGAFVENRPSRLAELASAGLTIATIVMIANAAGRLSPAQIWAMLPNSPWFWLAFVAYYFANPASEWVIFRRLWNLPAEGFVALLRKFVINEIVLDYLGEAKFYAWARSRLLMTTSPFGAVKDVAILSAMASNVLTLLLLLGVWPLVTSNAVGLDLRSIFLSLGVVLASSFAVLIFRGKLFSLPGKELRFILLVHVLRIIGAQGLTALMWHLVLPDIGLGSWMILATLRLLVARLPFVPSKDLLFSVVALYALGTSQPQLTGMLAMMAGLITAAHIVAGIYCAISEVVTIRRTK